MLSVKVSYRNTDIIKQLSMIIIFYNLLLTLLRVIEIVQPFLSYIAKHSRWIIWQASSKLENIIDKAIVESYRR